MFERFDEPARMVVVTAQEEARGLAHATIGGEHLLLGVATVDPALLAVGADTLREQVVARSARGQTSSPAQMPFTPSAKKALELSVEEAAYRGEPKVRPGHVLLALLGVDAGARAVLEGLGESVDEVRDRAEAAAHRRSSRAPEDALQALREGFPVIVRLGEGLPLGDLGNPRVDARLLRAMLVADGRAAALLREHGVDEDAIARLGP
jgi:ATP-dependent Clp protease ATP-binding subunit ClpA